MGVAQHAWGSSPRLPARQAPRLPGRHGCSRARVRRAGRERSPRTYAATRPSGRTCLPCRFHDECPIRRRRGVRPRAGPSRRGPPRDLQRVDGLALQRRAGPHRASGGHGPGDARRGPSSSHRARCGRRPPAEARGRDEGLALWRPPRLRPLQPAEEKPALRGGGTEDARRALGPGSASVCPHARAGPLGSSRLTCAARPASAPAPPAPTRACASPPRGTPSGP